MPGPSRLRGALAELAISTRKVTRDTVDERARQVLEFVKRASKTPVATVESGRDYPEDRKLNRKLAADSVVLLKNEADMLPLRPAVKPIKKIALIGPNMKTVALCGGGSASLDPYYSITPFEGITSHLPADTEVVYEIGAPSFGFIPALGTPHVRTPEGKPGLRMRFFREAPKMGVEREVIHETVMDEAVWQLMGFAHTRLERLFFADVEADLTAPESGLFEFGLPVYGNASLYIDGELVIDNTTSQRGGTFYFGKGTLEETYIARLNEGQVYKLKVEFASGASSKLVKPGVVNFGGGAGRLGMIRAVHEDTAIQRAVELAKSADITILCAGLSKDQESEGYDRQHMELPRAVPKLFNALLEAVPDTIVVTQSGTPFSMPWADRAKTHVHAWFGGNETGNGIADVLFGTVNPSGKLPLSFPLRIEHTPTYLNFGSERGTVVYGEGVYVGYRFYEKVLRDVLYPFG